MKKTDEKTAKVILQQPIFQHASQPFRIILKNLTDEKLYNVKLFDLEYDKQRKVEYTGLPNITYYEMLMQFMTNKYEIGTTRHIAFCDYKKFRDKQLNCVVNIITNDANGHSTSRPDTLLVDPYQYQDSMVDSHTEFDLCCGVNLVYEYLMPETEIQILMFPKSKEIK